MKNSIFCIVFLAAFVIFSPDVWSQRRNILYENPDVPVMINQAGYLPDATKYCMLAGKASCEFEVINVESNETVYRGTMTHSGRKDIGYYVTGDFTTVRQPGTYYIRSGEVRSFPFHISKSVYDEPMQLALSYFSKQRCGNSTTGFMTPCHVDDGIRLDNNKHQDVSGGWHDASDVRKWVDATIYGMVGILRMAETVGHERYRNRIVEELKWGNRYFLNMQEPEGYVMSHVGGDVFVHADNNRWTDNRLETDDNRIIQTKPAEISSQFTFAAVEAEMYEYMKTADPAYARKCLDAAVKCFDWCVRTVENYTASTHGIAIVAAVELYKATKEAKYKDFAFKMADKLVALQVSEKKEPLQGFFRDSEKSDDFYQAIFQGDNPLIGLCKLLTAFPDQKNGKYRDAVKQYCYQYLQFISERNAFGLLPYGVYLERQGGDRNVGRYCYRYFMHPEQEWWVGINANIAGKAVGLIMASRLLNDPKLTVTAQRQLDWIFGANPFGVSSMIGVGYSHPGIPLTYVNLKEFSPATPHIPGAVINGIGGDRNDLPDLFAGSWQTCEYWTPMICYTLWLMAELSAGN